ncbi:ATPase [candidate division KSB1 bacterium]|nr:MAG: ATPase [candidate division KSB1 bacterium]
MPKSAAVVRFDAQGVCSHCTNHQSFLFKGETELIRLLDRHRKPEREFDCIVNISGGRDSSYTLLKLVKDYGMRVLAVNYHNPFVDEQAARNIQRMVNTLGVKLVQFRFANRIHEKALKDILTVWNRRPSAAMVPAICVGCKIIWPRILRIAKEYRIRCIVNGGNPYEYTTFKKELLGVHQNTGLTRSYFLNAKGLVKEALQNLSYTNPRRFPIMAKAFLFSNQYSLGSRILGSGIEKIDLFHYIPWEENDVLGRIRNELGWEPPAGISSTWRFDCRLSHLKDLMYLSTIGVTEKDDFYSKMVRESRMTRDQALERIAQENTIHTGIIEDVLQQIGMKSSDARKLLRRLPAANSFTADLDR